MFPRLLGLLFLSATSLTAPAATDFVVKPFGAIVKMQGYEDGVAAGLGVSWPLRQLTPYLSAETEFMKTFSRLEGDAGNLTFSKVAAYAALTYPFDPRVQLKGKVGFRYAALKESGSGGNSSDTGADWGVGVQLLLDNLRSIELEYITSDENNFSQMLVGLRIQF